MTRSGPSTRTGTILTNNRVILDSEGKEVFETISAKTVTRAAC